MFTRFGGLSNTRVKAQIARGERIRALLSQPRYSGLRMADQVALLAALADGALDRLSPDRVPALRDRLPGWLDETAAAALSELTLTDPLSDDLRKRLVTAVSALVDDLEGARASGTPVR